MQRLYYSLQIVIIHCRYFQGKTNIQPVLVFHYYSYIQMSKYCYIYYFSDEWNISIISVSYIINIVLLLSLIKQR